MGKASDNKMNFTKTILQSLPTPSKQTYYWDTKIEGLGLGITPKNVKSFVLYQRLNGKPTRIKLGRFPTMSVEKARIRALEYHIEINNGNDPRAAKKIKAQSALALKQVYEAYLEAKPNLSPGTIRIYEQNKQNSFSDWWDKPMSSITEPMIKERHRHDGQKSQARANQSMRMLRALFNFAKANYKDSKNQSLYPHNPVEILSRLKSWYHIKRRTTVIKQHQLKTVFGAMMDVKTERIEQYTFRDYLLICLFTGLRSNEIASLKIDQIDLTEQSILLKGEMVKNKQDHFVPLNTFTFNIIKSRIERLENNAVAIEVNNNSLKYLFPSIGKEGYLAEPRAACDPVVKTTGIKFCSHDLRRTFITLAESLDISPYAWKQLVNHKIPKNDVSGGYVIPDLERLRHASQKICDFIIEKVDYKYEDNPI